MHWIYLSPHLDDAVLSCGGIIWQQVQSGHQVEIWTICAADPPSGPLAPFAQMLHARWQTGSQSMAARRAEDIQACRVLGAAWQHFPFADCIYRFDPQTGTPLIADRDDLFSPLRTADLALADQLAADLAVQLTSGAHWVAPLTLGSHRDHQLVRRAAEQLGVPLWLYADYPYAASDPDHATNLPANVQPQSFLLTPAALTVWQDAVAAYQSQLSSFWDSETQMRLALAEYYQNGGGQILWRLGC